MEPPPPPPPPPPKKKKKKKDPTPGLGVRELEFVMGFLETFKFHFSAFFNVDANYQISDVYFEIAIV